MTIVDGDAVLARHRSAAGARSTRPRLPDFTTYYDASLMNPKVLVGVFLGAMATFVFCAMTMKAVGRAAKGMVEEVRRQFREKQGIMDGNGEARLCPAGGHQYQGCPTRNDPAVAAGSGPAHRWSACCWASAASWACLVGTLTTGFCVAIFMANAGGSWDNAKKYIEGGHSAARAPTPTRRPSSATRWAIPSRTPAARA